MFVICMFPLLGSLAEGLHVANFVSDKLAPLDSILSTGTHFILKKYKDNGIVLSKKSEDEREILLP